MICLTRLNGSALAVNCDLIRYAESTPDTTLTLVTGEKLVVLESRDEVMHRVMMYRTQLLKNAWPTAEVALTHAAAFHAAKKQ